MSGKLHETIEDLCVYWYLNSSNNNLFHGLLFRMTDPGDLVPKTLTYLLTVYLFVAISQCLQFSV